MITVSCASIGKCCNGQSSDFQRARSIPCWTGLKPVAGLYWRSRLKMCLSMRQTRSFTKVYRFIKQNHINEAHHEALQRSGVKYYDEAAETLIKQGFSDETASSEAHHEAHQNRINEAVFDAVIEMLQKELEIKNEQIKELNERLSECSAALLAAQQTTQAAQVLHAGTIQKEIASGESGVDKQKSASEKKNRWFKRLFRG